MSLIKHRVQVNGQELQSVCTNAKRMKRSDGVWLQQDSALCSVHIACTSQADTVHAVCSACRRLVYCSCRICVRWQGSPASSCASTSDCLPSLTFCGGGRMTQGTSRVLAMSRKEHSDAIARLAVDAAFAQERAVSAELLQHCGVFAGVEYGSVHECSLLEHTCAQGTSLNAS